MPKTTCSVGKHWFHSKGLINGYLKNEIIEGRTNNANYGRLLVHGYKKMMMTRYAYDCEVCPCYVRTYIWWFSRYISLGNKLKDVGIDMRRYCIMFIFCCNDMDLNGNYITVLTKAEADAYLKKHPKTEIFKSV
jgi:hypothetical protein